MDKNEEDYALQIIEILHKNYQSVKCDLNFSSHFELLTAVILSAQCTDKRVNKITKNLFKRYNNVEEYANADASEFESYIRSAGFFKIKAKNIIGSAYLIVNKHNGNVPQTMEKLLELPGVARKTANVVLGTLFNKHEGIAVDTHVIRIANLLKLTKYDNPVAIERKLMKIIPKEHWIKFPFLIQTLGKRVCKSRTQNHTICPIKALCPSFLQKKIAKFI
ncbi:MAG: endonuclease III [Endomicrobium sp.]|jgi:endonuclease-3|nr:endonuclease III [Endomicrobium sp.]